MKKDMEKYIEALEDELCASLEREKQLAEVDLSLRMFLIDKFRKTRIYNNIISEPDSKIGKIARAPRSFYRVIRSPEVRRSLIQKKTLSSSNDALTGDSFLEPWKIDLAKREALALNALNEGKKIALYYVDKPDSSTFRYRCYNTLSATIDSKKWQAVFFDKKELASVERFLSKSALLILGRQSGQEKAIDKLVKASRQNGVAIGLDIDDLVFDIKYLDVLLDTIGERTNRSYWLSYFAGVQAIAENVDFFITTNNYLSKRIKESFKKPCREIRNSLNSEQIRASLVYSALKNRKNTDKFVIGYFSGSPTHKKDLEEALPGVIKMLEKHNDVVLNIVGYMKLSKEIEKYVDNNQIRFLPFTDFRKLQRLMAEVDVNIAPLVINDFTNCKSELKFFEAAVVETTTIASPNYSFKKAITDGKNGFLAKPGEWYQKLEYLYNHPEENRKIALEAKKYALKHYYGEEFLKEVEEAYDYFAK